MLTFHSAVRRVAVSVSIVSGLLAFITPASLASAQAAAPAQTTPAPSAAPAAAPAGGQISIDVEVTDKSGKPVAGLGQADFTLLDNNQPASLLNFQAIDAKGATADRVHVVIVLDAINIPIMAIAREREQLTEFLKQNGGELSNPASIAILADTGLKAAQGSTRDGNALLAVLEKTQSELRTIGRSGGFWGDSERLQSSLTQLSQLVSFESSQSGRKLIVFLSPGWPLLPRAGDEAGMKQRIALFNNIVQLENSLREGNITLYSLDPSNIGSSDAFYYQTFLKPVTKVIQAEYAHLGLQVLAVHSGGLAQVTGNDILGDLNRAFLDATQYYTLTFPAPAPGKNTDYHALRVQVDKPGLVARTSAGYYVKGPDAPVH